MSLEAMPENSTLQEYFTKFEFEGLLSKFPANKAVTVTDAEAARRLIEGLSSKYSELKRIWREFKLVVVVLIAVFVVVALGSISISIS